MASIILYQTGNRSRNPRTGQYHDPWDNHIWLCIEEIREWNPLIDVYMITDDSEIKNIENFDKFNIKREFISKLNTEIRC
jgi:hypothetical protein